MAVPPWPRLLARLAPYAAFVVLVLLLHYLTTSPQTVRVVNASGERLARVDVRANGSSATFENVGLGEARTMSYRSGWLEPRYRVHVQYEVNGTYSFAADDSTAESPTFIIGHGDYDIYYDAPTATVPRYEQGLRAEETRRAKYAERVQKVEGLSDFETTLHTFSMNGSIRILEMMFRTKDGWGADTYYLYDSETLFASTRRDNKDPTRLLEAYYFNPEGRFSYFTSANPPANPEDRVQIDAAYEVEYFKRFLAAAKSPADTVQIDWINRE
jgi:hypothetical protein